MTRSVEDEKAGVLTSTHEAEDRSLGGLAKSEQEYVALVEQARRALEEDSRLTTRQAFAKYKKAVFWAMFLSVSNPPYSRPVHNCRQPHRSS